MHRIRTRCEDTSAPTAPCRRHSPASSLRAWHRRSLPLVFPTRVHQRRSPPTTPLLYRRLCRPLLLKLCFPLPPRLARASSTLDRAPTALGIYTTVRAGLYWHLWWPYLGTWVALHESRQQGTVAAAAAAAGPPWRLGLHKPWCSELYSLCNTVWGTCRRLPFPYAEHDLLLAMDTTQQGQAHTALP